MSSGGVDVSVPTLILDMSDYATIESLWAYQTQLSVSAPLALTNSGGLSISTSGFQPAFGLTVPTTGQVQLFNSTLNAFQALAPGTGIALSSSTDGKTATIATTGLQSTLLVSTPLILTGNTLSVDSTAFITATPANDGMIQIVQNGAIRLLSNGNYIQIYEPLPGVVRIGTTGLQPSIAVAAPIILTGHLVSLGNLGAAAATPLSVSGSTSSATLTTSAGATLNSLGVTNACTVGGTLGVRGAVTLANASCSGTLGVTGVTTLGTASIATLTGGAMTTISNSIAAKQATIPTTTSGTTGYLALWDGISVIKGLVC